MKKIKKGGMETIIAAIIIMGIIAALLYTVVVPMAGSGEDLLGTTTESLVKQDEKIRPLPKK